MKKVVCELCECNEFVKDEGMFICQGCGTKYTLAEAKALMVEVEDGAPAPAPSPAPTVNISQQIDNLLVLAENAFGACNNSEAEGYCDRILELDVTFYKAWLIKGKAICWMSTYGKPRVTEGASTLKKAIEYAHSKKVSKVYIYSTFLNELIDINNI